MLGRTEKSGLHGTCVDRFLGSSRVTRSRRTDHKRDRQNRGKLGGEGPDGEERREAEKRPQAGPWFLFNFI